MELLKVRGVLPDKWKTEYYWEKETQDIQTSETSWEKRFDEPDFIERLEGHQNILIYNRDLNEVERFEPHGYSTSLISKDKTKDWNMNMLNKLLGGVFGALKIGLILSVAWMIFSSANRAIPFLDEEDIESSILYEPVRSIAPLIFTSIIKDDDVETEETASSDTI